MVDTIRPDISFHPAHGTPAGQTTSVADEPKGAQRS
jgi:hypothetical protein